MRLLITYENRIIFLVSNANTNLAIINRSTTLVTTGSIYQLFSLSKSELIVRYTKGKNRLEFVTAVGINMKYILKTIPEIMYQFRVIKCKNKIIILLIDYSLFNIVSDSEPIVFHALYTRVQDLFGFG